MANNITRRNQPTGAMPLSEAVDRLFREALTWPRTFDDAFGAMTRFGGLSSNLYETRDSYIMQVVLPGVRVDELEITAHENVLTLQLLDPRLGEVVIRAQVQRGHLVA